VQIIEPPQDKTLNKTKTLPLGVKRAIRNNLQIIEFFKIKDTAAQK
jgi:hypothetical protein